MKKKKKHIAFLDYITIIFDHPCDIMFLAAVLIWTPFSPWVFTFCFCINLCSQNSVKLIFTNIKGLCSNFFACERFFISTSPDILALCEINLQEPTGSSNFYVKGYLPLVQKDSFTQMHGLTVYVKEVLSFAY